MGVAAAGHRQARLHYYGIERPDRAEGCGGRGVPAQGSGSGLPKPKSAGEQRLNEPESYGSVRAQRLYAGENSARYRREAGKRRAHVGAYRAKVTSDGGAAEDSHGAGSRTNENRVGFSERKAPCPTGQSRTDEGALRVEDEPGRGAARARGN